jgi:hypothetical protein
LYWRYVPPWTEIPGIPVANVVVTAFAATLPLSRYKSGRYLWSFARPERPIGEASVLRGRVPFPQAHASRVVAATRDVSDIALTTASA